REAELARSIYRSGDWTVPRLGERPFLDKPPLFHAAVAAAFHVAGRPSVLAARLVAAAFALATLALTAWGAQRLAGAGTGLVAAILLATSFRFYSIAHEVVLDGALATFTTGAILAGALAARRRSTPLAALAALALALAFLTKGLVGVGL